MSDHTTLWILFALFSVLLVLVVVTARRGPWQGHLTSHGQFDDKDQGKPISGEGIPEGAYIYRVDSPTHVTLRRRRRHGWHPHWTHKPKTQASDVDPLWGKNPPGAWD